MTRPPLNSRIRFSNGHEAKVIEYTERGFKYRGEPYPFIAREGSYFTGEGEVFTDVLDESWRYTHFTIISEPAVDSTFPSEIKNPLVEIYRNEGDPLIICGLQGNPIMLELLEKGLDEYTIFDKGNGSYLCRAQWIKAQIGDEGRVEIPAYWDLDLIAFKPTPVT